MGVYDQGARYLIKRDPDGFIRWVAPRFAASYQFVRWLDTSTLAFPGDPDRLCDTVGEFRSTEATCLLDIEVQTEPDPRILERIAEYSLRLRREHTQAGFVVCGLLVSLTGSTRRNVLDMTVPELEGAGLSFSVLQKVVRDDDACLTLNQIEAGIQNRCLLPWIPLMRGGGDLDTMSLWMKIADTETDLPTRLDFGGIALVFAELTDHAAIWKTAMEGWNMIKSPQVMQWQAEIRQQDLLRLLGHRFPQALPPEVESLIKSTHDPDLLSSWFDQALTTPDLNAFQTFLRRTPMNGNVQH